MPPASEAVALDLPGEDLQWRGASVGCECRIGEEALARTEDTHKLSVGQRGNAVQFHQWRTVVASGRLQQCRHLGQPLTHQPRLGAEAAYAPRSCTHQHIGWV